VTRPGPGLAALFLIACSCAQDPTRGVTVPVARHTSADIALESRWPDELIMRHDGSLRSDDQLEPDCSAVIRRAAMDMSKVHILPGDDQSPMLPDDWLYLRVDEDVAFKHVARLLSACSAEHIRKLAFVTPVDGEVRVLRLPIDLGAGHGTEEALASVRLTAGERVTHEALAAQLPGLVPSHAPLHVDELVPWSEVMKAMDLLVDLGMDANRVYPELP